MSDDVQFILSCGTIRCCDSSPNRHARYCFVDDVAWEA
jgi:hypothetical protein